MQSRVVIDEMEKTAANINSTAKSNNRYSQLRKEITGEGMEYLSKAFGNSADLVATLKKLFANLESTVSDIADNSEILDSNRGYFENSIEKITSIREVLQNMNGEIGALTEIVETIKNNTDEIFSLALNASIVSSKYTRTSGVFDIIANKLNEMSNFIGENLKGIIRVVDPITDGLEQLVHGNNGIIEKSENGYKIFTEFKNSLDEEKQSVETIISIKSQIDDVVTNQRKMLADLKAQLTQMNYDSDDAIKGSGNNIGWSEQLMVFAIEAKNILRNKAKEKDSLTRFKKRLVDIKEVAHSIFVAGASVYTKSQSQLEFSRKCAEFCEQIIEDAGHGEAAVSGIDEDSKKNNEAITQIANNMQDVNGEIQNIIDMIEGEQAVMDKFNYDYGDIDNIIGFLRNIMKSMNLIGMLSRIESSREPEEYMQFMTISENIRALQAQIYDNIPVIEKNVERTRALITTIRTNLDDSLSNFSLIKQSGDSVNTNLIETLKKSSDLQNINAEIITGSKTMGANLLSVRDLMNQMLEIIPHPIEGGAFNRDNANKIEGMCDNLLQETAI